MSRKPWHPPHHRCNGGLRGVLLPYQDWRCPCGRPLDTKTSTLEHVIPRSKGGPDRMGNVLAACDRCNRRKADRDPTGCELIWLFMVNAKVGRGPMRVSELWTWAP